MQVMDIVDGPLSKEEFDLIAHALHDPAAGVTGEDDEKDQFEELAKHVVRWRCAHDPSMFAQPSRWHSCDTLLFRSVQHVGRAPSHPDSLTAPNVQDAQADLPAVDCHHESSAAGAERHAAASAGATAAAELVAPEWC